MFKKQPVDPNHNWQKPFYGFGLTTWVLKNGSVVAVFKTEEEADFYISASEHAEQIQSLRSQDAKL